MDRHHWNLAAAEEHRRNCEEFISPLGALSRGLAEPLEQARSARLRLPATTQPLREGDRVDIGYGKSGTVLSGRVGGPDSTGLRQYWVKPDRESIAHLVWVREDPYGRAAVPVFGWPQNPKSTWDGGWRTRY